MDDTISRQALLNKFEPWLKVKDYSDGELNMLKAILYEIRFMPPATDKNVGTKLSTNLAQLGTDCISRQQAIDAVEFGITYARAFNKETGEVKELFQDSNDELRKAVERIKQLPPIQPEPSQVARDIARIVENEQDMRVIAQPEIIKCKDCKYWIPYDWMFSEVWQSRNIADYPEDEIGCAVCDTAMKADDFCSRAERRTE